MASWQYTSPTDKAPVMSIDQGYYVNHPDASLPSRNYKATNANSTAALIDQDGNTMFMYLHEISMSFEIGGTTAQSPKFRQWYPRNFTQPLVTVVGQVANEAEYGALVEFVRTCQRNSLRWKDPNPQRMNQITLKIREGGPGKAGVAGADGQPTAAERLHHEGHKMYGHILNIERKAERWVNAPEFTFQFMVATADAGLFNIDSAALNLNDLERIVGWMQILDDTRSENPKPTSVVFAVDPDPSTILTSKAGNVVTSDIPVGKV